MSAPSGTAILPIVMFCAERNASAPVADGGRDLPHRVGPLVLPEDPLREHHGHEEAEDAHAQDDAQFHRSPSPSLSPT